MTKKSVSTSTKRMTDEEKKEVAQAFEFFKEMELPQEDDQDYDLPRFSDREEIRSPKKTPVFKPNPKYDPLCAETVAVPDVEVEAEKKKILEQKRIATLESEVEKLREQQEGLVKQLEQLGAEKNKKEHAVTIAATSVPFDSFFQRLNLKIVVGLAGLFFAAIFLAQGLLLLTLALLGR